MARCSRILLAVCLLASGGRALAQEESAPIDEESRKHTWPTEGPQGEQFVDVAKELRCPTCTGLSVLESDAKFSVQIKDIVKEQVEQGKSKDEILKYFTERYGPWILRAPPKTGFNVLAWALPIGVLILGPLLVWFFVWRKRKVVSTQGVRSTDAILAEMHDRLAARRARAGG
jgi:cytochrome c-type biogenesis protein CcmH/NrfF